MRGPFHITSTAASAKNAVGQRHFSPWKIAPFGEIRDWRMMVPSHQSSEEARSRYKCLQIRCFCFRIWFWSFFHFSPAGLVIKKKKSFQWRQLYSWSGKFPLYPGMEKFLLWAPQDPLVPWCCWPFWTTGVKLCGTNHAKLRKWGKRQRKSVKKLPRFSQSLLEEINDISKRGFHWRQRGLGDDFVSPLFLEGE